MFERRALCRPRRATLRGFDEVFTALTAVSRIALDYCRRVLPLLERIGLPTLILTSRDDPFIAVEPFHALGRNRHIEVQIADHGGHLGFLGWDSTGGNPLAEQRVVEWVMQMIKWGK